MARWSNLRYANGGNCDEKCQGKCNFRAESVNRKSTGRGNDDEDGMPGVLFDQVVLVLLRRLYAKNAVRSIPVLLQGSGSVDLLRLLCLVREKGGFDSVSRGNLWGLVAKNLDLDFRLSASLKMVYFNNLGELDQWLDSKGKDWNAMKMSDEFGRNLEELSIELEKRFRALSVDDVKLVEIDKEVVPAGCNKICDHIEAPLRENLQIPGAKKENKLLDDGNIATSDDDENIRENEADKRVGRPDPDSVESDSKRKRKRKGFEEMLSWLKKIAKNPCELWNRRILNSSKWRENCGSEYHSLALLVRGAMLKRKYPNSNGDECCSHQMQKIHPSMYDDPTACPLPGIRFSKRVPALVKSPNCPCCISSPTKESGLKNHSKAAQLENDPEDKEEKTPDSPASCSSDPTDGPSQDEHPVKKRVYVGPQFQAKIPPLTGAVSESDSKWLGTRIWPPYNWEQKTVRVLLGKGRPDICNCPYTGSVECVRFHTVENNLKLKGELGQAFYQWRFDRIGEVVSLSWTPQEEEEFKSVMCGTPLTMGKSSFPKKTRQELVTPLTMGKSSFPKKTRQELVNYYFNVFVQRKRSYQNRVTPNEIDSDDELSDFESVGGLYGHVATTTSGSNPGICTQNGESLDVRRVCEGEK